MILNVMELLGDLESFDLQRRRRAIDALFMEARANPGFVLSTFPTMIKYLRDKDTHVRLRALEILSIPGTLSPKYIDQVAEVLAMNLVDGTENVVWTSIGTLTTIGQMDRNALRFSAHHLLRLLRESDSDRVKRRITILMDKCGLDPRALMAMGQLASARPTAFGGPPGGKWGTGASGPPLPASSRTGGPHEPARPVPRGYGSVNVSVPPPKAPSRGPPPVGRTGTAPVNPRPAQDDWRTEPTGLPLAREAEADPIAAIAMASIREFKERKGSPPPHPQPSRAGPSLPPEGAEPPDIGPIPAQARAPPAGREVERAPPGPPGPLGQDAGGFLLGVRPTQTFDNFVVGKHNQIAAAAGRSISESPCGEYNPLFVYSGVGLGKSHLLNAIALQAYKLDPSRRVIYTSSDKFALELTDALQNGTLNQTRGKYTHIDLLLVDDIQFLTGKERTQEEFFHIFNELVSRRKQIVLSSDRPPNEIVDVEDRLISRFEMGFVIDMQPPDLVGRIEILEKKAEERGITLPPEIIHYIASNVQGNIRQLEGALNKVIGIVTLSDQPLSMEIVQSLVPPAGGEAAAEPTQTPARQPPEAHAGPQRAVPALKTPRGEPGAEPPQPVSGPSLRLEAGMSYLIEETRPNYCFQLFEELIQSGHQGFCITRSNPARLRKRFEMARARLLWLTDRASDAETISPRLETMIYSLEDFIRHTERGVLLLDGLEYLLSANRFDPVLKFIRELIDIVSESKTILLIPINTQALTSREVSMLEREMEVVDVEGRARKGTT